MAADYKNFSPRLLAAIETARARVCLGYPWWLRPFLQRDVIAITLGRRIYLRGIVSEATLRHELAHVRQVSELGLIRFLWRYLREFLRNWWKFGNATSAYANISFEIEARAAEDEPGL